MSVYAPKRQISQAEYLQSAMRLRKIALRTIRRMPKSYRYIITNSILELVKDIFVNCVKSEGITLTKNTSIEDFKLKRSFLVQANCDLVALQAEITFCYELIQVGNSAFKNKAEYDKIFELWIEVALKTLQLIRGKLENDKLIIKKLKTNG